MSYVQYAYNYPESAIDRADGFGSLAGGRSNPHRGGDIAPEGGGPVKAVADGTLVSDWWNPVLGNVAVLAHLDGKFSGYAHMASESPMTIGTKIARGQGFGTIGATGSAAKGRHLHLTIATSMAGAAGGFDVIDPFAWIDSHLGAAPGAGGSGTNGLYTAAEQDGEAGYIYWLKVQSELKKRNWYGGAVDGKPGTNTHHGHARLQAAILNEWARKNNVPLRTSTEDDGQPGGVFWKLAQMAGREFGYTGLVDSIPGAGTMRSLTKRTAWWLNRYGR